MRAGASPVNRLVAQPWRCHRVAVEAKGDRLPLADALDAAQARAPGEAVSEALGLPLAGPGDDPVSVPPAA